MSKCNECEYNIEVCAICIHRLCPEIIKPISYIDNFKQKQKTIMIGDMEVPEPVREPLERDQPYYVTQSLADDQSCCKRYNWRGDAYDKTVLERGLVHLTKEAAKAHSKALIKVSGGKYE